MERGRDLIVNLYRSMDAYCLGHSAPLPGKPGYTLTDYLQALSAESRVVVWHNSQAELDGDINTSVGSEAELWHRLQQRMERRVPVMAATDTDWRILLLATDMEVRYYEPGSRGTRLTAVDFRKGWRRSGNLTVCIEPEVRERTTRMDWFDFVPQKLLRRPAGVPSGATDYAEVEKAVQAYADREWGGGAEDNLRNNLAEVFGVLERLTEGASQHHPEIRRIITHGGIAGYSLYVHWLTRIGWFFDRGIDPAGPGPATSADDLSARALSLSNEHRFLQSLTTAMHQQQEAERAGHSFSVRDLILANPHDQDRETDWEIVAQYDSDRGFLRRPDDYLTTPEGVQAATEWYYAQDFRVIPD